MMTRKVPVAEIEEKGSMSSVEEIVRATLANDPKNAYTIMGIMVEKFDVEEDAIASLPFNQWGKGLPSLYTRVRLALEKLVRDGEAKKGKSGRAQVYWWIGQREATRPRLTIKRPVE
jgi:hypothetical protein